MDERLARTLAAIGEAGAAAGVLTSPEAVAYATGHIVPIEAGPSPFAGGPTTALIGADGGCAIIAANVEGAAAQASHADVVELYEGFGYERAADYTANYLNAVKRAAARLQVSGVLAAELHSFPQILKDALGASGIVDITPSLNRQRAIKTEVELAALAEAARVASIGQGTFRSATRAGRRELEVFADIRAAMEVAAGERLPVTGDFMSGIDRTAGFTAWPSARIIEAGDPVMSDLAPRVRGYWGDSCASAVVGDASPAYLRLFQAAREALDAAAGILRPGLAINDFDRQIRDVVGKHGYAYPHHSGHSIGTSVHEWPRLVPFETASFEPGMVVMVEPGAYDPEVGGVRTEWMFAVTAGGCRVLTEFEQSPTLDGGRS